MLHISPISIYVNYIVLYFRAINSSRHKTEAISLKSMPNAHNRKKSTTTPLSNNKSNNCSSQIIPNLSTKTNRNSKDYTAEQNSVSTCTYSKRYLPQELSNRNLKANNVLNNDDMEGSSLLIENSPPNIEDIVIPKENNGAKQLLSELSGHDAKM